MIRSCVACLIVGAWLLACGAGCDGCPPDDEPEAAERGDGAPAPRRADGGAGRGDADARSAPSPEVEQPEVEPAAPLEGLDGPTKAMRGLAAGEGRFAVDLYHRLRAAEGNLVSSPASVYLALGMVHAGARGESARALEEALHLPAGGAGAHEPLGGLLRWWSRTRSSPTTAEEVQRELLWPTAASLRVVNRLFAQQGQPFQAPFVEGVRRVFGAPLQPLEIARDPEGARLRINQWAAEETSGTIPEIVPRGGLTERSLLVLVNAVHMRADWRDQFETDSTEEAPFFVSSERRVTAKMMHNDPRDARFLHVDEPGVKVLELDFFDRAARDHRSELSMAFLLPDDPAGLAELEAALTTERLSSWLRGCREREVDLWLPRFRIEPRSDSSITGHLRALGLDGLFEPGRADLGGIAETEPPLVLEEVFHAAFIEVHEEGIEAGAATAVAGGYGAGPPADPVLFRADHPFLFLVRDRGTGALLFLGRLVDPSLS